jgi:hypothetical protein
MQFNLVQFLWSFLFIENPHLLLLVKNSHQHLHFTDYFSVPSIFISTLIYEGIITLILKSIQF